MRVPVKYHTMLKLDRSIATSGRQKFNYQLPPRHEKLFAIAEAEGVVGKWVHKRNLLDILNRHEVGAKKAGVLLDLEQKTLADSKNGVAHFLSSANLSKTRWLALPNFVPGLRIEPPLCVLDFNSNWQKPFVLEQVTDLKFSVGAYGAVVEQYPFYDHGYALIRVLDYRALSDFLDRTHHKEKIAGKDTWLYRAGVRQDYSLDEQVLGDAECAAIMARPPAIVESHSFIGKATAQARQVKLERLRNLEAELARLQARKHASA